MEIPILKTGCLAYYDSFAGLVPVKVLSVKGRPPPKPGEWTFDLCKGNGRVSVKVMAQVTNDHSPYRKGEILESNSADVVPRSAILRYQYSTTIGLYLVVEDKP